MAHDEKNKEYELTETAAVNELGHESGDRIKIHSDAPEVHTDSRGNTHRLERYINLAAVVNFGILVLVSWESFAVSFQFALANGGPASLFYGSILAGFGCCATGLSLAELAAIDPTVGAQYRWSANLAPFGKRFFGLLQGWITTAAWCFACAGPSSILANMITSLAIFNSESYEPQRWHTSLIMIATVVVPFVCNIWFRKVLDVFEITGGILHIVLFIVFIAVLISFGPRNDPDFVFKNLVYDQSGWSNKGVCWGLGLLSVSFPVVGFDSVLHMCDEVKKVRTRVPRSIILTCVVNSVMQFIFVIVLLFYIGPLTEDITTAPLPLIYVLYRATGSVTATNAMVVLVMVIFFFCLFNIFASVSRLVWIFACDNGLPFSPFFAQVHPTLKLPLNALYLLFGIVTCLSLIYIASATAFNAFISLQSFALYFSYFFPIFFMLLRKLRGPPPPFGPFQLGRFGIPINIFSLCYLIFVLLWMPFPQFLPVVKDNMNYSGPIFGGVLVLALGHWFLRGRKTFKMPVKKYE